MKQTMMKSDDRAPRRRWMHVLAAVSGTLASLAMLAGCPKGGDGEDDRPPVPSMAGDWRIAYDESLDIELTLGGTRFETTLGPDGGTFTAEHDDETFTFDLDCSRENIVCPREALPVQVAIEHIARSRFFSLVIPTYLCDGAPGRCDPDDDTCTEVCDGEVTIENRSRPGQLRSGHDAFDVLLDARFVPVGPACAFLGGSVANARVITDGSDDNGDPRAVTMEDGLLTALYGGGCLLVGDPDDDGDIDPIIAGASVKITTGFTGTRR